ncbi:MAG: VacJ family lipoprotein [Pseudomonadota bacterium]
MRAIGIAALLCAMLAAGCSTAPGDGDGFANDPWESTNRDIHSFNKGWDTVLIRPAARGYQELVPGVVKLMASNALDMLSMPAIFANRLLQGDIEAAGKTLGRFGINAVLGGGLLDPATEFGLPYERTDLGVTFGRWGIGEGPYMELPLLGPSTARDAVGTVAQIILDPFNLISGVPALTEIGYGALGVRIVDIRSDNLELIDRVLYESADSYVTARTGYLQVRRRQVAGGLTAEGVVDVFEQQ